MSSISDFSRPASFMAFFTGLKVFLKRSALSSSNLALVRGSDRSTPSMRGLDLNANLVLGGQGPLGASRRPS